MYNIYKLVHVSYFRAYISVFVCLQGPIYMPPPMPQPMDEAGPSYSQDETGPSYSQDERMSVDEWDDYL